MNIKNNKKVFSTIAVILMLSMAASMMLVSDTSAHTPAWNVPTFAFINVAPNPVGVNQPVHAIFWLSNVYDGALFANDYRFHNYKLTITAPDGTVTTKTYDIVIDSTSSQYTVFNPTQVGTYTFKFDFLGTVVNQYSHDPTSAYVNDTYLPSSATTTLTVQQAQLPAPITSYPLPTQYWTRPIYGENTDWWAISSNWLGTGAPGYLGFPFSGSNQQSYPGDAVGSQTSHVMWTKVFQTGGVVGGNNLAVPGDTYFEGSAYIQRYTNPIIVQGRIFYTEALAMGGVPGAFTPEPYGPTKCVDLRTGQLVWSRTDVPALSFAYIQNVQDTNQHGVMQPILIAATGGGFFGGAVSWSAFDADTGTPMWNATGIPSGTTQLGPMGEMLMYTFANYGTPFQPKWYLQQWNSSHLWEGEYFGASTTISIIPTITNGSDPRMIDWNVSIPQMNTLSGPYPGATPLTVDNTFYNNMLICHNGNLPSSGGIFGSPSWTPYTYYAINLNPAKGAIGSILWTNTVNPPAGNVSVLNGPADPTVGVFTEATQQTMQWTGYSMATGQKVWGPTASQTAFDYYGTPAVPNVQGVAAYGKLYSSGFGGICYCYDLTNGNLLWTYGNGGPGNSTRAGFQNAYGDYPTFINAIGNGVVHLVSTEHTITTPIYKGAMNRGIDATTGKELWTISAYTGEFFTQSFAMADGFDTWFNGYDNQIYVVGRGPSKTTIQAPLTAITLGSSLMIQGTVTDISAGTKQDAQAADFPNGVPVVSDASMTDWMGYVYQQKPCPTNAKGATVHVTAIDPNGNFQDIGNVTTDLTGLYHVMWTPPVPGEYVVTATFTGTNGYWPSQAETAIGVSEAPSASVAPTPTPTPTITAPPTTATPSPIVTSTPTSAPPPTAPAPIALYAAIAAAVVIIVVVAAAVVLRKRK